MGSPHPARPGGARRGRDAVPPREGADVATIEAMYSDRARLRQFLHDLWHGTALGSHGFSAQRRPMVETVSTRLAPSVSNRCVRSGSVMWQALPQPAWGGDHPVKNRPTFSTGTGRTTRRRPRHHDGDADLRAEVSLGVGRPANPATAPMPADTRHWPVELFWKCGQPRFEGWVTWRDKAEGGTGQVTVIVATPATPDTVYPRPVTGAGAVGGVVATGFQGMWLCTHADNPQYVVVGSIRDPGQGVVGATWPGWSPTWWDQSGRGPRNRARRSAPDTRWICSRVRQTGDVSMPTEWPTTTAVRSAGGSDRAAFAEYPDGGFPARRARGLHEAPASTASRLRCHRQYVVTTRCSSAACRSTADHDSSHVVWCRARAGSAVPALHQLGRGWAQLGGCRAVQRRVR